MRPATRRAILAQFPVGRTLRFSAIRRTFLQFLGDGPPAFSFLIAIRSRFSRRGPSTTGTGGIDKQKLKTSERSTQRWTVSAHLLSGFTYSLRVTRSLRDGEQSD